MLQPGDFECTNCGNTVEWNPKDINNRNVPFEKCPNCNAEVDEWQILKVWFDNDDNFKKAIDDKLNEIEKDGWKIYSTSYEHEKRNSLKIKVVYFLYTWKRMTTLSEKDMDLMIEKMRLIEGKFIDNFMTSLLEKCLIKEGVIQKLEFYREDKITYNVRNYHRRNLMCEKYTYAIPCLEILEVIKNYVPILEIGAGSGFWGALLRKINCEIIVTTIGDQSYKFIDKFPNKFTKIEYIAGIEAVKKYPNKTVLWIWPGIEEWTEETLENINGRLIYIGEGHGGHTGTDKFHDILEKKFNIVQIKNMLQWEEYQDNAYIYERK